MKSPAARTQTILERIARPNTRSSLFWWMLEHHDGVMQSAEGRRQDWKGLCATFQSQGLTDLDGNPANARTARMTWWRVRKEKARINTLRAAERAERERRGAGKAKLPATTVRQAEQGLQLSTAEGVVVTKVTRVFKLREDGEDYVFSEDGSILPSTNLASALTVRQQMNISSRLPVNDKTERLYAELELRSEYR
jgi:hypothetical protein